MNVLKASQQNTDRYSGTINDNFNSNFVLFPESCDQETFAQQNRHSSFSSMLNEPVLNIFFKHAEDSCEKIHKIEAIIWELFVTQKQFFVLLEWKGNNTAELSEKAQMNCFCQNVVKCSHDCKRCNRIYHKPSIVVNCWKLVTKWLFRIESLSFCAYQGASILIGDIEELETSVETYESDVLTSASLAVVIDRRRYQNSEIITFRGRWNKWLARKYLAYPNYGYSFKNDTREEGTQVIQENCRLHEFITEIFNGDDKHEHGDRTDKLDRLGDKAINITDVEPQAEDVAFEISHRTANKNW